MSLHEEKQYLKELKFTHEKQVQKGKLNNAENTLRLIQDCEKRIEKYSVKKEAVLVNGIIWKPIKGWEKTHLISNTGLIKKKGYKSTNNLGISRFIKEMNVALQFQSNYLRVVLTDNKRTKRYCVGNLVYEHFIGEIPPYFMARPKDNDLFNCNDYNLYLGKVDNTVNKYKKTKIKFA